MSCETSLTTTYNIKKDDDTKPDANSDKDTGASIELSLDEDGNTESPAHFEIDKETGKDVWIDAKVKTTFAFGDTAYLKLIRTDKTTPYEMAVSFGTIAYVGAGFSYLQAETVEFANAKEADLGKEPFDGMVQWKWNGKVPNTTVSIVGKKITLGEVVKAGILECTYRVEGERWALKCPFPSLPVLTEQPIKVVAIQGKLNASTNVTFVSQEKKEEEQRQEEKEKNSINPSSQAFIEISLDESQNLEVDETTIAKGQPNPNIPIGYKEKTQFGIPDTAYMKVISEYYTEVEWGIAKEKAELLSVSEEWGIAKTKASFLFSGTTLTQAKQSLGNYTEIVSQVSGSTGFAIYKWVFTDGSYLTATFSGDQKFQSCEVSKAITLGKAETALGSVKTLVSQTSGITSTERVYRWGFEDGSYLLATFSGNAGNLNALEFKSCEISKKAEYDSAKGSYKMESGFGTLAMVASGCTYKISEYITFTREISKKLKYGSAQIETWSWEFDNPGFIGATPRFDNGNITLPEPVLGTLLVIYTVYYHRWSLTVSQSVGDLGEPEASRGAVMNVPVVAYQDAAQASMTVPFQKKTSDTPERCVLQAQDCATKDGIKGAVITFRGTSYIMNDKGECDIGLVPPGTYTGTLIAKGYIQITKDVQV